MLLRMTAERHGVAAKVIATVDDLDRIAADDDADVPALHGWRRELFGEKALALKHGRLSLAIEKGRVVAVEPRASALSASPAGDREREGRAPATRVGNGNGSIPSQSMVHRRDLRGAAKSRWRARSATSRW